MLHFFLSVTQIALGLSVLSTGWDTSVSAQELVQCNQEVSEKLQPKSMLFGSVEYDSSPEIEAFVRRVNEDARLPCTVKFSLPRLVRVAENASMRKRVWRRMKSQELYWVGAPDLSRIEAIAAECNMSLVR